MSEHCLIPRGPLLNPPPKPNLIPRCPFELGRVVLRPRDHNDRFAWQAELRSPKRVSAELGGRLLRVPAPLPGDPGPAVAHREFWKAVGGVCGILTGVVLRLPDPCPFSLSANLLLLPLLPTRKPASPLLCSPGATTTCWTGRFRECSPQR